MEKNYKEFEEYISKIEDEEKKNFILSIFDYIEETFPTLKRRVAWNQPMYTMDGTFIFGLSMAAKHTSIAPERKTLNKFADDIKKAGYEKTQELFKIRYKDKIDFQLIRKMIEYNMEDKKGYMNFWRKPEDNM